MTDPGSFALSEAAAMEWDAMTDRPAQDLEGLRRLLERPSPFDD